VICRSPFQARQEKLEGKERTHPRVVELDELDIRPLVARVDRLDLSELGKALVHLLLRDAVRLPRGRVANQDRERALSCRPQSRARQRFFFVETARSSSSGHCEKSKSSEADLAFVAITALREVSIPRERVMDVDLRAERGAKIRSCQNLRNRVRRTKGTTETHRTARNGEAVHPVFRHHGRARVVLRKCERDADPRFALRLSVFNPKRIEIEKNDARK
jgi:hypothetical protein